MQDIRFTTVFVLQHGLGSTFRILMEADIEMRALGMRRRENLTERPPQSAYSKAWRQNTIYNAFGEVLASQYGARKSGYWYSIRFPLSAK